MGGGLLVGLSNEDAARFSFLLATPIIGAAALLKLPELFGSEGNGVRGPALVAALCAALTAYLSVRFLMRYFETNRLTPFAAIYCFVAGLLSACTSPLRSPAREPTLYPSPAVSRAVSSVGRAPARQAGGHWFEPSTAHSSEARSYSGLPRFGRVPSCSATD